MGRHKKHHKKHSHSHHPTPAFPNPTPVFNAPLIPPVHQDFNSVADPAPNPPPSLRISIGLNALAAAESHESEVQQKHHRKSHHHHHRKTTASSAPSAGAAAEDRPTIPPLRISLHSSSSRLPTAVAPVEEEVKELKVSIPLSRERGGERREGEGERRERGGERREGEGERRERGGERRERGGERRDGEGERREREKHHKKKHKKHKERRWHDAQEAVRGSGGGKGAPGAGVGGKQIHLGGEGERKSYGGEGERKSYGGEGERKSYGGDGERKSYGGDGERKSYGGKGERKSYGGEGERKSYGGEGERKSYGGKGLGAAYKSQKLSVEGEEEGVTGGAGRGGSVSTFYKHERPQQSPKEHPLSHSYTSQSHHSHPSHPHPPQGQPSLENKFSDKYYQHRKRMMERGSAKHTTNTITPSPSHPSPALAVDTSHPHTITADTTPPVSHPEPHKQHKKKKKHHKHSRSLHDHSAHSAHSDTSLDPSVATTLLDDGTLTTPTYETREHGEIRPLSPVATVGMTMLSSEREVRGDGGRDLLTVKRIKFTDHTQDSTSYSASINKIPLSRQSSLTSSPTSSPSLTPTPLLAGKGSRGVSEATPPKRRSSTQRCGMGKDLRLQESEGDGVREFLEGVRGGRGGKGESELTDYDPPPLALEHLQGYESPSPRPSHPQVVLSKTSLKMFLANLLHLIQKRDPEGVFAEPVTDDIAPGYSALIKHPMDLSTMATKVSSHAYCSVEVFKDDFVLMCKNAMTYNSPETVYYAVASNVMKDGLRLIEKEVSLRPDIRYGRVATPTLSATAQLSRAPSPTHSVDYSSSFLVRINLKLLQQTTTAQSHVIGMETSPASSLDVLGEMVVAEEQSHLTQVVVGVPAGERDGEEEEEEEEEREEGDKAKVQVSLVTEEEPDEILRQVQKVAEEVKENLDANRPNTKYCFIQEEQLSPQQQQTGGVGEGRAATMNILNPDSGHVDSSKPLNITALSERVRAGNNAATVLRTELPMFKATPVSYLMNGPFGSFAPTYDSAFATLTKMDSDLLLHTYGSDLGVSYSHSLLQFVKGAGSFASEMADAVLNSLTAGRHETFMDKYHAWEERERLGRMKKTDEHKEEGEGEGEGERGGEGEKGQSGKTEVEGDGEGGREAGGEGEGEVTEEGDKEGSPQGIKEELPADENDTECDKGERSEEEVGEDEGKDEVDQSSSGGEGEEGQDEIQDDMDWSLGGGVGELVVEGGDEQREEGGRESQSPSPSHVGSGASTSSTDREEERGTDESSTTGGCARELSSSSLSPSQDVDHISPITVSDRLAEGACLLSDLQTYQWQRLAEPPSLDNSGHTILPPPSQEERKTASQLTSQLASLTAQVRPCDVVQTSSLHQAMGISLNSPSPQQTPSASPPHTQHTDCA